MLFKKKKIKATTKELGETLSYFIFDLTMDFVKNDEKLSEMNLSNINKDKLFYETMIMNMFCVIESFNYINIASNTSYEILDVMNRDFVNKVCESENDYSKFDTVYNHIKNRYNEYNEIMKKYANENYLQQLSKALLYNIDETFNLDAIIIFEMANELAWVLKTIPDVISKYKIVS